jgi:hypothetical protein
VHLCDTGNTSRRTGLEHLGCRNQCNERACRINRVDNAEAQDSLIEIEDDGSGDTDGGEEGVGATVITHGDAPPVLEPAEHIFNLVALLVELPVVFDLDLRFFLGGMQGVIPFSLRAALNQSAS